MAERYDVVVVGYGFAGGVAAISAHDAGARVLLIEKMPFAGGLSIVSGGGIVVTEDEDKVFQYLQRTCNGATPDPVVRAMAHGMTELPAFLRELEANSSEVVQDAHGVIDPNAAWTYPFPGGDAIRTMKLATVPNFPYFPWVHGMRGGARLFRLVADNVESRGIEVRYNTPARRLIGGDDGGVMGVITDQGRILARRGVILACGGFEWNEQMKRQFLPGSPIYPITAPGNTGDGIRMAQEVGADLWHMWHIHGSYGLKFPDYPGAFRHRISGCRVPTRRMPWILLDRRGRRFMNEYPYALQDTAIRDLMVYDPEIQDFPRIPCWMVFDEEGRKTGPIAFPIFEGDDVEPYSWSADNLAEIDRGWILKADTLEGLERATGLPAGSIGDSARRWNEGVAAGADRDFSRLPGTMMALSTPPYHAIQCWPIVSNTQGGPVHDEHHRVLRPDGSPVPRLYAVGELGSLFGHLYLEAGNVAECFVGGRIAGRGAAEQAPPDHGAKVG